MFNIKILFLLFLTYSFLGWIMEMIVTVIEDKEIVNRGFLVGPYCPIYGVCSIAMILLLNKVTNPILLFVLSIIICSVGEYLTSYILEKIFNARWWDYSNMKFNLNGRICLECASGFGIGALLMIYVLNPILLPIIESIPLSTRIILLSIISIALIFDLFVSFGVIINLKNISNNIRSDSTEIISKKVKEILLSKNIIYRRLKDAFPNMQIKNTSAILKEKLEIQKAKLEKQKQKFLEKQKKFTKEIKELSKKKTTKK